MIALFALLALVFVGLLAGVVVLGGAALGAAALGVGNIGLLILLVILGAKKSKKD